MPNSVTHSLIFSRSSIRSVTFHVVRIHTINSYLGGLPQQRAKQTLGEEIIKNFSRVWIYFMSKSERERGKSTSFPFVIFCSSTTPSTIPPWHSIPSQVISQDISLLSRLHTSTLRRVSCRILTFSQPARECWNNLILFIRVITQYTYFDSFMLSKHFHFTWKYAKICVRGGKTEIAVRKLHTRNFHAYIINFLLHALELVLLLPSSLLRHLFDLEIIMWRMSRWLIFYSICDWLGSIWFIFIEKLFFLKYFQLFFCYHKNLSSLSEYLVK